jgi:anti-sigma regulatory factor (Ser/Thr protein kinase)
MSGRVGAVEGAKDVAPSTVSGEPSSDIGPASILSTMNWPLASYLELGALPSAVPSARLHARLVMAEWGFASLADAAELIVSELVTNAIKASQALGHPPPVWLGLAGNERHVFIGVWDGNVESGQTSVAGDDELPDLEAEGGRGLLLVDSLSADWGVYWPEDSHGKVVWSVVTDPEAPYRNRVFTSRISRIVAETGALSSPRYAASTGYGRACDSCASAGRA